MPTATPTPTPLPDMPEIDNDDEGGTNWLLVTAIIIGLIGSAAVITYLIGMTVQRNRDVETTDFDPDDDGMEEDTEGEDSPSDDDGSSDDWDGEADDDSGNEDDSGDPELDETRPDYDALRYDRTRIVRQDSLPE